MGKHEKSTSKSSEKLVEIDEESDVEVKKVNKKATHKDTPVPSESSESSGSESEEESTDAEEDEEDDDVSVSTSEILNSDPLYTILSQFFMTEDGKNITEVLEEINVKLSKYMRVRC